MRFLVQRVIRAAVAVDGKTVGEISRGFLVFAGISKSDVMDEDSVEKQGSLDRHSLEIAEKMTKKLLGLRIFEDENGKTNLDLKAVGGSILLISQFTLYADCRKGNRPSFTNAGEPEKAKLLYQYIIDLCRREIEEIHTMEEVHSIEEVHSREGTRSSAEGHLHGKVAEGIFGADMKVELVNDGPFTVLLDSDEILH